MQAKKVMHRGSKLHRLSMLDTISKTSKNGTNAYNSMNQTAAAIKIIHELPPNSSE